MNDKRGKLTVYIPCFNEGGNVERVLKQIQNFQETKKNYIQEINFILFDDGSNDGSMDNIDIRIKKYNIESITVYRNEFNLGLNFIERKISNVDSDFVLGLPGDLRYKIDTISIFYDQILKHGLKNDVYFFSDSKDRRGRIRQAASQIVNLLVRIIYIGEKVNKVPKNVGLICIKPKYFKLKSKQFPSWSSTPFYKYLMYNRLITIRAIDYENRDERRYSLYENILLIKRINQVLKSFFLLIKYRKEINEKLFIAKNIHI